MTRFIKSLVLLACVAVMATSCVSPRNVRYLQDMQKKGEIPLNTKFEAVISPYDEIRIMLLPNNVDDEEMIKPFNVYNSTGGNMSANSGMGYLVDIDGNIEFPSLGKLKVSGLTRLQLIDTIQTRLVKNGLLTSPMVDVRFMNFKIYFLGSEGGKAITISNERCTFLEALAMAGDLGLYTSRSKIGVAREVEGKMVIHYLDPRSSKIFDDPFFMLQQNDIIITEAMPYVYYKEWMSNVGLILAPLSTLASVVAIVLALKATFTGR